jgi:hypothetical protein
MFPVHVELGSICFPPYTESSFDPAHQNKTSSKTVLMLVRYKTQKQFFSEE